MESKPGFEVHWYALKGWARLWCTLHAHPIFDPVNSMKEAGDRAVEHFKTEHVGEVVEIVIQRMVPSEQETRSSNGN